MVFSYQSLELGKRCSKACIMHRGTELSHFHGSVLQLSSSVEIPANNESAVVWNNTGQPQRLSKTADKAKEGHETW